jgi:hypothetical protein
MANDEEYQLPIDEESVIAVEQPIIQMSAQKPPDNVFVPKLILNQPPVEHKPTFIERAEPVIVEKEVPKTIDL